MSGLLDMAIRELREDTAVEADGALTRQRLEAGWLQRRARRRSARKLATVAALALLLGGGALAATNLAWRARSVAPAGSTPPRSTRVVERSTPPRTTRLPEPSPPVAPSGQVMTTAASDEAPAPPVVAPRPGRSASEVATAAYAAAHRAHFVDRDWLRALGLWTRYLHLAPGGPLAPEAHFNRAICLLHLDRRDDAVAELQPFASGRWGSYRQSEARQLLASITSLAR